MLLREVRVSHVRSYELFSAKLDPEMTLLLGQNGTGKTTLLEAMYYLLQGTSFRGRDRDMIAHDSTRAELALELNSGDTRRATLQQTANDIIKKTFIVGDKTTQRLPAKERLPVVLFEPSELRLINSSPDRRRRFFDSTITRLYCCSLLTEVRKHVPFATEHTFADTLLHRELGRLFRLEA